MSDRTRGLSNPIVAATRDGVSAKPTRPRIKPSSRSILPRSSSPTVAKRPVPCDQPLPPCDRRERRQTTASTSTPAIHGTWMQTAAMLTANSPSATTSVARHNNAQRNRIMVRNPYEKNASRRGRGL